MGISAAILICLYNVMMSYPAQRQLILFLTSMGFWNLLFPS